jgi:hypothetical protein
MNRELATRRPGDHATELTARIFCPPGRLSARSLALTLHDLTGNL